MNDLGAPYLKLACGKKGAHIFHCHCLLKLYVCGGAGAGLVRYYNFISSDRRYTWEFRAHDYIVRCPHCREEITPEYMKKICEGLAHVPEIQRTVTALRQFSNDFTMAQRSGVLQ